MNYNTLMNENEFFYKNDEHVDEVIKDYLKCLKNNNWINYDLQYACVLLSYIIYDELCKYGYCDIDRFITHSLKNNFKCLTSQESELIIEVEKAFKNGNIYNLFQCPHLSSYIKLETERFSKLQSEYKNDRDLIHLEEIYLRLKDVVNHDVSSQKETIELINESAIPVLNINTCNRRSKILIVRNHFYLY
jgi:hypothetical protein